MADPMVTVNKTVQEIVRLFACVSCDEMLEDCRRTTCGHWICSDCVDQLYSNKERSVPCPECNYGLAKGRSFKEDDTIQAVIDQVNVLLIFCDKHLTGATGRKEKLSSDSDEADVNGADEENGQGSSGTGSSSSSSPSSEEEVVVKKSPLKKRSTAAVPVASKKISPKKRVAPAPTLKVPSPAKVTSSPNKPSNSKLPARKPTVPKSSPDKRVLRSNNQPSGQPKPSSSRAPSSAPPAPQVHHKMAKRSNAQHHSVTREAVPLTRSRLLSAKSNVSDQRSDHRPKSSKQPSRPVEEPKEIVSQPPPMKKKVVNESPLEDGEIDDSDFPDEPDGRNQDINDSVPLPPNTSDDETPAEKLMTAAMSRKVTSTYRTTGPVPVESPDGKLPKGSVSNTNTVKAKVVEKYMAAAQLPTKRKIIRAHRISAETVHSPKTISECPGGVRSTDKSPNVATTATAPNGTDPATGISIPVDFPTLPVAASRDVLYSVTDADSPLVRKKVKKGQINLSSSSSSGVPDVTPVTPIDVHGSPVPGKCESFRMNTSTPEVGAKSRPSCNVSPVVDESMIELARSRSPDQVEQNVSKSESIDLDRTELVYQLSVHDTDGNNGYTVQFDHNDEAGAVGGADYSAKETANETAKESPPVGAKDVRRSRSKSRSPRRPRPSSPIAQYLPEAHNLRTSKSTDGPTMKFFCHLANCPRCDEDLSQYSILCDDSGTLSMRLSDQIKRLSIEPTVLEETALELQNPF